MKLRTLPIGRLRPAPYNPRKPLKPGSPAYRRLARSLEEFDLVQPIVWNERTGHVVGGHQRLEILRHRGAKKIEVAVVSLSLEREKALNVALNNAQLASDWDMDKLSDLVSELVALPDFDATLTGFDARDISEFTLRPDHDATRPSDATDEDSAACVEVILEVPADQWDDLRPALDEFLFDHPLRVHVRPARRTNY